jgi:transglutaminase-like putative cysteine protease
MSTKHSRLILNLILACAIGGVSLVGAESTNRYAGELFAPVDTKAVLAAAAAITTANYPDCDEAAVERRMIRVYRPDGTGEAQDDTFTKVLTEKGKRNNRTLSLGFMLPYNTVQVARLEIIKPNGETVPVDVAANSKETIDDSQMQMNIYDPNVKVLSVSIPALEIGDLVHAITRQTTERSIIPGEFSEGSVFEGTGYIRHMSYEVHAPAERPLKRIALRAPVGGTVAYTTHAGADKTVVHHWEITNVPRMFDEPAMPPYAVVLQRLFISTIPDWQSVSKWYWQLSQPHLEATTAEMKQTVEALTLGAKTDLDKVKALFYHVSKKVRYMGLTPEKDRPGYEPHDVKITFDKKYGVCRDKAALLVSLLRTAGLTAYPVLINVGTHKDQEVPDADFNHAIVSVELKPGQYELMDPTDENTRDLLPYSDCNQSYLVCRPEGETLKLSPIQPPADNLMEVRTTGSLSAAGRLEARSEIHCAGVNDDMFRNMLVHMKPDDQRRYFERSLKQALPGARLKSLSLMPTNMLDVSESLSMELEFYVGDVTASGAAKSVVSLPWIGNQLGVLRYLLAGAGLEKRKYPMQTWVTYGLKETISLKLGAGLGEAISLPTCAPVVDDCLDYHQTCQLQSGALDCARELKLQVVEFSPAQYQRLKQTLKQLDYDARKAPILANPAGPAATPAELAHAAAAPVESNAEILDSRKELEVTDAHTAVYRVHYSKRILNYAGKIREAELKLDFNPACQEAKLLSAVVISKTGKRQEISKEEINVMDAGWNASAKRYTGGKILVANLPGVDVGSTLEVAFELKNYNKPFISGFEPFQLVDELDQKAFRLTAPEGIKVEKLITGPADTIQQQDQVEGGKRSFEWRAEKIKALPAESQLPPDWAYAAGVEYFAGDLNSYLQTLHQAMLQRSGKNTQAAERAHELSAGVKSKLEGIKAIRDFVAKNIREAGPSFTDLPLTELSDADRTLADGYGHSADRAILLHAMLTAAGFKPEFVLASGLPPISGITNVALSFPLPYSFTAPLVRLNVEGTTIYLNDTDQYAKLGSTVHDGRLGLVLASQTAQLIRAANQCNEKTETLYTLSLQDDGKTRLGVTRHFYGPDYNQRNRYFSELPPEEKKRYYQEVVSGISQGAQPVSDLLTRFDTYPGLEQFTVEINNFAVADGRYFYFDLPFTPSLFPPGADTRALPLYLSGEREQSVRTEIELPAGFKRLVMAPREQTLQAPAGTGKARRTVTTTEGRCVIAYELDTRPGIVEPKDYAELLDLESALGKKSSRLFLLEKAIVP